MMENEKKQFAVNISFPMRLIELSKVDLWKDPSNLTYNITIRDYRMFHSILPECSIGGKPLNINIEQVIMDIKNRFKK